MKIILNGKEEVFEKEISVLELLRLKNIRPEVVVVEVNEVIIDRSDYDRKILRDGDVVEMVFFMGGGMEDKQMKKAGLKVAENVLDLFFNTPIVKLNRVIGKNSAEVFAKLEAFSPGGSVKDRIALSMIETAEKEGLLKEGSVVVEPTSGNTGIGLALVCAVKGYRCILVMPESMSLERIYILKTFGAEVVLTPAIEGMQGAVKKAEEIVKKTKNAFMPQQFKNPSNPEIHRKTTAQEIIRAMDGKIDAFVAGVGTGGTITGVGEVLKKMIPDVLIVAVEPHTSAVLSGKPPGPHKIQGIGAGFIPDVLNRKIIDRIVVRFACCGANTALHEAKEEGIFCGISSGAACFAAIKIAEELGTGKRVVTVFPDTGERYFSIQQYFEG
jgi:cysteine synthase A